MIHDTLVLTFVISIGLPSLCLIWVQGLYTVPPNFKFCADTWYGVDKPVPQLTVDLEPGVFRWGLYGAGFCKTLSSLAGSSPTWARSRAGTLKWEKKIHPYACILLSVTQTLIPTCLGESDVYLQPSTITKVINRPPNYCNTALRWILCTYININLL